ncbi:jhy protein homolog isoform X2 [Pithys albifrons albifrons]|uniref:jhy protein homolog isoform X2 n=1 Tax=Pithys albifrons albifrons TaxID=3385563 RepID=UPI003A5D097F
MNKIHVPPKVLMPPVLHPLKWKKASVREGGFASNLQDSQDSDCESLAEGGQHQLGLQQRILEKDELVGLCSDELENDSLEEDSLEEMSLEGGSESDISTNRTQNGVRGRKQQSVDKYSHLGYNPNWKKTQTVSEYFGAEQAPQVVGGSSVDFSQDSFYLHSSGSSEEKYQQEARTQVSFSEFDSELLSFHEPNVLVSNEAVGLQSKKKESADSCHSKGSPSAGGSAFPLQNQQDQPQRAKKNFVKKNKQTLGLPSERINSYLELYSKNQQVLQEQDQHNKFSQRNKTNPNQSLKGRDFPSNDIQQPPGRPAEPKSWPRSHQHTPGFRAAPSAAEQDEGPALQECLHPDPSGGPHADPATKSNTCRSNFPSSSHFVKQDLTTSACALPPPLHHSVPAEVESPARTSTESQEYLWHSPSAIPIPHGQQHSHNHVPGQQFASADRTGGQAHPKQRNIPPAFTANFEELVRDQVPLWDCKNQVHEDRSSPRAPCATSQLPEMMEQHDPGVSGLAGAHFADRWLLSLLPPAIPQPCSTKLYINLNVKLGGLGPDYEAIKEKKQKLKLQKEYSRQIKEYNMKNITFVQRLPTKPQVTSSVSRKKALEYAKKIPRPKTFMTRQSDKKVKEGGVLPQTSDGTSLPQIPSLETLRSRHEKEKEVVAAFKALHIL